MTTVKEFKEFLSRHYSDDDHIACAVFADHHVIHEAERLDITLTPQEINETLDHMHEGCPFTDLLSDSLNMYVEYEDKGGFRPCADKGE